MSIGVIRKWRPEDIDSTKYPKARNLAEKFRQPEVRLGDLRQTSGKAKTSGEQWEPMGNNQRCPHCGSGGNDWGSLRPDTGPEVEPLGVTQLGQGGDISIGEPMDLSFRLLKDSARYTPPKDSLTDEEAANIIDGVDEETCPTCGSDLSDIWAGHPNEPAPTRTHSRYPYPMGIPKPIPKGVRIRENKPPEKIRGRMRQHIKA